MTTQITKTMMKPPTTAPGPLKSRRISREQVLESLRHEGVRFLRLVFTDIMGMNKNVVVREAQFA